MDNPNQQTPEGKLIQDAQNRMGISSRKAAEQAGMSDTRWRNIVNGYQAIGHGQTIPITAPAVTLARMARVVDVSGDELADAGREDARDAMGEIWPGERRGYTWSADTETGTLPVLPNTRPVPEGGGLLGLIASKRAGRTIASLSDACGGDPTPRRLQQIIADGIKAFPDPNTIAGLAAGLQVSVRDVVLACAATLGLDVDDRAGDALVIARAGALPAGAQSALQSMAQEMLAAQAMVQHAAKQLQAAEDQLRDLEERENTNGAGH